MEVAAVVRTRVARCWVQTSHRCSSDQFAQARQKSCRSLSKSRIESPLEMQGVTAVMLDEARRRKKRLAKKTQSDSDDMLDISESQWISLGRFGSRFSRLFRMMGMRRKGRMRLAWDDGEGAGISFNGAQKGKYTKELVSIAGGATRRADVEQGHTGPSHGCRHGVKATVDPVFSRTSLPRTEGNVEAANGDGPAPSAASRPKAVPH